MTPARSTQSRLPAEWEAQSGVILTWPHSHSDWKPLLNRVEPVFAQIAAAISQHQPLLLLSYSDSLLMPIRTCLQQAGAQMEHIRLVICPSNDTWTRDYAPIGVLREGRPVLLDFDFDAWGGKFDAALDNRVNRHLYTQGVFTSELQPVPLVLEGGSIESDGCGSLLTTTRCLLHADRNPQYTRTQLETELKKHLHADRILWLQHGELLGDDTDGHIDNLARFVNVDSIAYLACEDPHDPHYRPLQAMQAELQNLKTRQGEAYRLYPIPLPAPVYNKAGRRLPASYLNFLIINDAVLLPVFDVLQDQRAAHVLQSLFPTRRIIPINCRALVEQNGGLHCSTMQLPAGTLLPP